MAKYILEAAGNINWMAVFSLVTFMAIFITSSILILRRNSDYIEKMSNMPLNDDHEDLQS
ncbi:MAG TPA: hypothetical protein PKC30_15595 [Saprospiraceae bacterium]|nr:hypothetical protein [Saprospiraceae bacterium]